MRKVIVTVAVCGSSPTKEMNPAIPYSPEEIAESALSCWRAGAAIAHIHVRNPETGQPDSNQELFREVADRIRAESDMIINLTTSGLNLTGSEEDVITQRLQVIELKPEICSLDVGSVNFKHRVFTNSPDWGKAAARKMKSNGVKPEIEIFDVGHIEQAIDMIDNGLIESPAMFQLCMGVKWGIAATAENLIFLKGKLPMDCQWSVLGVGSRQLAMITHGILLGGHVRVGFEDNIYLKKGVLAKSNSEFVAQAVDIVHQLQHEVATPNEARAILGLHS